MCRWFWLNLTSKALREEGESEEAINLIKKASKIKVLTVENSSQEMLDDYAQYLNDNHYEDWATIKHDGDHINIRVKQNGDTVKKYADYCRFQ
jgi:hypothetical protein